MKILILLTLLGLCSCWIWNSPAIKIFNAPKLTKHVSIDVETQMGINREPKQHGRRNVAKLFTVGLASAVASFHVGSTLPAMASSAEAAKLFGAAEEAIAKAATDYKTLDKSYATTSRNLDSMFRSMEKSSVQLKDIQQDLSTVLTRYQKALLLGEDSLSKIQQEIASLQASAADKYTQAQESARKLEKPAVTAKLFKLAQNEAAILQQTEKLSKSLSDEYKAVRAVYDKKLKSVYDSLSSLNNDKLVSVAEQDKKGFKQLEEGLAMNAKVCKESLTDCSKNYQEGVRLFDQGVATITTAQGEYGNNLRTLENTVRQLDSAKVELAARSSKLEGILDAEQQWEKKSGLSLRTSKGAFTAFKSEVASVSSAVEDKAAKLETTYRNNILKSYNDNNLRSSSSNGKNKKGGESLTDQLKEVDRLLGEASTSGRKAESAFNMAKTQGEREAKVYTSNKKVASASSVSTAGSAAQGTNVAQSAR